MLPDQSAGLKEVRDFLYHNRLRSWEIITRLSPQVLMNVLYRVRIGREFPMGKRLTAEERDDLEGAADHLLNKLALTKLAEGFDADPWMIAARDFLIVEGGFDLEKMGVLYDPEGLCRLLGEVMGGRPDGDSIKEKARQLLLDIKTFEG